MRAETQYEGDFAQLCAMCCVLPFLLGIVGAAIAYYVFGIIFLVDDRYICYDMSPLWIFSLTALLTPCLYPVSLMVAHEIRQCVGGSDAFRYLLVSVIVNAAVFIYGGIMIYSGEEYVCAHMRDTGLYVWAQVAIYLNLIAVVVLTITIVAVAYSRDAEDFVDNHLNRGGVARDIPPEDGPPQHAVPVPPSREEQDATWASSAGVPMQSEKDPLLGAARAGVASRDAGSVPAAGTPIVARAISELD